MSGNRNPPPWCIISCSANRRGKYTCRIHNNSWYQKQNVSSNFLFIKTTCTIDVSRSQQKNIPQRYGNKVENRPNSKQNFRHPPTANRELIESSQKLDSINSRFASHVVDWWDKRRPYHSCGSIQHGICHDQKLKITTVEGINHSEHAYIPAFLTLSAWMMPMLPMSWLLPCSYWYDIAPERR